MLRVFVRPLKRFYFYKGLRVIGLKCFVVVEVVFTLDRFVEELICGFVLVEVVRVEFMYYYFGERTVKGIFGLLGCSIVISFFGSTSLLLFILTNPGFPAVMPYCCSPFFKYSADLFPTNIPSTFF
jgi:hypothetical protein